MNCEIATLANFDKKAKKLAKRYQSFKNDYAALLNSLREDPHQGVEITAGVRKVRMTISSKGRGKSGGARVITYDALVAEMNGFLLLVTIYDKADQASISTQQVLELLRKHGF